MEDLTVGKEAHRYGNHDESNKNWIVTIDDKDAVFLLCLINHVIKLTEIVKEEKRHYRKVTNRLERERLSRKEGC